MKNKEIRFDQQMIQEVLDNFTTFTGARVSFDCGDVVLYGKNQRLSGFCTELRKIPRYQQQCLQCDVKAKAEADHRRDLYVYKCHMGFWEVVAPILIQGEIAAYLTIGQIVDRNDGPSAFLRIRKKLEDEGVSQEVLASLEEQFYPLQTFTYQEIRAGANLLKITGEYLTGQRGVDVRYGTMIETVTAYLEQNFQRSISSREIEEIAKYRYTYVCDVFKREMGCTITQYMEKLRLRLALTLLETTSMKIYEISEQCGYKNNYYFNRVFKRTFHCTPQEYRQKVRHSSEAAPPE